jgi:hypothetical protein
MNERKSGKVPKRATKQVGKAVYRSPRLEGTQSVEDVAAQVKTNRAIDTLVAETVPPEIEAAEVTLGQPVFHSDFRYGEVTGIDGMSVTVRERRDPAVTHIVGVQDLITKSQAEFRLQNCWFAGGAKAWRRGQGKWASMTKNLCRFGEWAEVLQKCDLNRSSMDDLIRRFEMTEDPQGAAPAAKLPDSGNLNSPTAEQSSQSRQSSVYAVSGFRQVLHHTPDAKNVERQHNIHAEASKRAGVKPTPHKTTLFLQRRNLDPEKLALYHAIRTDDEKRVDAIMQRKIDEGIEGVLSLAPSTPPHNQRPRPNQRRKRKLGRPQERKVQNVRSRITR